MRLDTIEIENYRQYKNLKFSFQKIGRHDLHLIIAENGVGKTNLLNAITWCLYGNELHLGDESKSLPKLNIEARNEAKQKGIAITKIAVKIIAEDEGRKIIYERILPVNVAMDFQLRESFSVSVSSEKGDYKIFLDDEAKVYVNKYLPETIRKYFFFDGEQLHDYFTSNQNLNTRKAVHDISQVDMLSRIIERIDNIVKEKQRNASSKSPDIERINNEIITTETQIEELNVEINQLNEQIIISKDIIAENTEKLKGQDNLPELEASFQRLEKRLNDLENDKKLIDSELFSFIRLSKIALVFYPYAKKTLDIIYKKKKSNSLPPNIDKNLLKEMITKNRCLICNRALCEKDEEYIANLLDKISVSTETSHMLLEIQNELEIIIKTAENYKDEKEKFWNRKRKNEKFIEDTKVELEQTENAIAKFTDKALVIKWHKERNDHKSLLETNSSKLAIAKDRLSRTNEHMQKLNQDLNKAMNTMKELTHINHLISRANDAKIAFESIEKEMMQEVKGKIEKRTTDYFSNLIWKKNTYDHIELNDQYELDLIHVNGDPCVGSCGAAERALLALSFTLALHEVSGFNTLLFIDTPVARVSGVNRANFARILNEVSCNKQIIMTFTIDEYSEDIRKVFQVDASSSVKLHTEDERITKIV